MIFRQLFDSVSSTYTCLLASRRGGKALIIDPVPEKVDRYLQLIHELDLKPVAAVDAQLHADHVTGLGLQALAASTGKRLIFYCAFGERCAMAVQDAQHARLKASCHLQGGVGAWKKASGPLAR